ncbi:MAG: ATP-binding cassette domain-containing protein, partial [bacterium]|nr:ATP-binding cassette domain-containing protein [bacterium]
MGLSIHITKHLKGFSLQVDLETESLITGLLGASGCGKSMTLRCIAGIERPDEGEIILNGKTLFDSKKHIHLPPQEREVGYLFQNYALFPNMSVEQNILAGLCREKDRLKKKETVELLLQDFSLLPHRRKKPQELSGGQAQRTALARILASKPQLLLLDEPFSALDSYLRDQLQVQMRETLHHFQKDT